MSIYYFYKPINTLSIGKNRFIKYVISKGNTKLEINIIKQTVG